MPKKRVESAQTTTVEDPPRGGADDQKPDTPQAAYRQVGQEVLKRNYEPACWAQALALSESGHDEAVSHYVRLRTKLLAVRMAEINFRESKRRTRLMENFKRLERSDCGRQPRRSSRPRPREVLDSVFWHFTAAVAAISCLIAVATLKPAFGIGTGLGTLIVLAAALQFVPAAGWLAGRVRSGSLAYARVAQMSACLPVAVSVALGIFLLSKPGVIKATVEIAPTWGSLVVDHPDPVLPARPPSGLVPARTTVIGKTPGLADADNEF